MAASDLLENIVRGFDADPVKIRQLMTKWLEAAPDEFLEAAITVIFRVKACSGANVLIAMLLDQGEIISHVSDPDKCDLAAAVSLSKRIMKVYPPFDALLQQYMESNNPELTPATTMHRVELLKEIGGTARLLPTLMDLSGAQNPRLRSRAVKLVGCESKDATWLSTWLEDADPRVRANAVESLWGAVTEEAVSIFRTASEDEHHRVSVNGMVGLYMAGLKDIASKLQHLGMSQSEQHRAAAAWGMGVVGESAFSTALERLARDPSSLVRNRALRALVKLRQHSLLGAA